MYYKLCTLTSILINSSSVKFDSSHWCYGSLSKGVMPSPGWKEKAARQNRTAGRKGLIKVLPAASPVFRDLELAREDFLEAQYKGLQEVEKAHLRELLGKVSENVKHVLRG